ncbi:MAG: hypothetical protein QOD56_836 [Gammaproteobacteria bacterium]|jgi:hypothetical protein|nr:hypothetical protein [Gammaproteobacteria bacterium]
MPAGSDEQRAGSLLRAEVRQGAMSLHVRFRAAVHESRSAPWPRRAFRPRADHSRADRDQGARSHCTRRSEGQLCRLPLAINQPLFVGADGVGVPSLFGVMDSIMRLQLSIMWDIFCCMS